MTDLRIQQTNKNLLGKRQFMLWVRNRYFKSNSPASMPLLHLSLTEIHLYFGLVSGAEFMTKLIPDLSPMCMSAANSLSVFNIRF